jgi:hypothetical protein
MNVSKKARIRKKYDLTLKDIKDAAKDADVTQHEYYETLSVFYDDEILQAKKATLSNNKFNNKIKKFTEKIARKKIGKAILSYVKDAILVNLSMNVTKYGESKSKDKTRFERKEVVLQSFRTTRQKLKNDIQNTQTGYGDGINMESWMIGGKVTSSTYTTTKVNAKPIGMADIKMKNKSCLLIDGDVIN